MSNIDKQALRKAAIAATGGKWVFSRSGANSNVQAPIELQKGGRALVVLCKLNNAGWSGQIQTENNAKFIAAASPETVLALLDEVEKEKGYASAFEAEKWHYHGLAESEGERADRAEKALEAAERERDNWRTSFDNERFRADKLAEAFKTEHEQLVMAQGALITQHIRANRAESSIVLLEAEKSALRRALNNLAAVARRYLPDYDEHPDIQAADDLLESAAGIGKGE
ncbi:ead/Ea22-like family protein [Citrobacter freundii]|nr:ead/Ea22-like family protein [Citrobacter freundii]